MLKNALVIGYLLVSGPKTEEAAIPGQERNSLSGKETAYFPINLCYSL